MSFTEKELKQIKAAFPILDQVVNDYPLTYLDNAATTQKPVVVIDRIAEYYRSENANIHRGVHRLSQVASDAYENARKTVQQFINARSSEEIIFVRGTSEAINLVASSFGDRFLADGDEVLVSAMEHHANIVPWQLLAKKKKIALKAIPMDRKGTLKIDDLEKQITKKTRLISVVHVSNALGTINPVEEIVELAHAKQIPVLLDCAQSISHIPVDVQKLNCDFIAFSGHKIYGPTGIGILYGKSALLNELPPYQGGGDMIRSVSFEETLFNDIPYKFEAGTPNIAGAIGLATALDFLADIGMEQIQDHETTLYHQMSERLRQMKGLRIIADHPDKASALSFILDKIHPHDIGTILDQYGVAIRTGHHCAQPVMDFYGIPASARASIALYNNENDIDRLVFGLKKTMEVF